VKIGAHAPEQAERPRGRRERRKETKRRLEEWKPDYVGVVFLLNTADSTTRR
jgi:hypothetical protein